MAAPLLKLGLEQLMVGLAPGANEESAPIWIKAQDVVFDGSAIRPLLGFENVTSQSGEFDGLVGSFDALSGSFDGLSTTAVLGATGSTPIKGIWQQMQSDGERLVVIGTDTELYLFVANNTYTATRVSGVYTGINSPSLKAAQTTWSFAQWGNWVIATNGRDTPQILKYPDVTRFVDITNFPCATAEIVRVLGPHVVFINTSGTYAPTTTPAAPNQIVWCKQEDPEEYDPTVAGNETAGELVVREALGAFVAAEVTTNALILYTERDAHVLEYGGTFIFGAKRGAAGVRVGSKNGVAVAGDLHYSIAENGITVTDGLSVQPVDFPRLGDWLTRTVNWAERSRICAMSEPRQGLIKWSLPTMTGGLVLTLQLKNTTLGTDSRPFEAAARAIGKHPPICGFVNGVVQQIAETPAGRVAELESKPLALGDREAWAFLDLLVFRQERMTGTVQFRWSDTLEGVKTAEWRTVGSIAGTEDEYSIMQELVYLQIRVQPDNGNVWALSGIDFYGKKAGRRY